MPVAIVGGIITVATTRWAMDLASYPMDYVWGGLTFLVCAVTTLFIAFFHRKTGDILIDTESEMRKVVWPNRDEVTGSTIVVIGTVVLLGLSVYAFDWVIGTALTLVGLY